MKFMLKCLDYEKEEKRVGHKAYNLSLYDVCTIDPNWGMISFKFKVKLNLHLKVGYSL